MQTSTKDWFLQDLKSCSCTSLRTTLISTLLGDLFGGLQSELPQAGTQMPCSLMKCLDDKHNWDRSSVVKTNLRNFFSQLLVGELDIAIATAIEKYHAKWIGASCADAPKMIPGPEDDLKEGWEQRAVERRAKHLAEQLAEQMFNERAEQLTKQAKDIVRQGPPPCKCGKKENVNDKSILPCLLAPIAPFKRRAYEQNYNKIQKHNWHETCKDVTELKNQVQALQKSSINKDDLKIMEKNITDIIQNKTVAVDSQKAQNDRAQKNRKKDCILRNTKAVLCKNEGIKGKKLETRDAINSKKNVQPDRPSNPPKNYFSRNFAVNLCLCGNQKPKNKVLNGQFNKKNCKGNEIIEKIYPIPGDKSSAPIKLSGQECAQLNSDNNHIIACCDKYCHCLRKEPSNKSLDILIDQITKWESNLNDPNSKFLNQSKCNLNGKCPLSHFSKDTLANASLKLSSSKKLNTYIIGSNSNIPKELSVKAEKPNDVINSASVYMADVNLDKSNEFINKDVNSAELKKRRKKTIMELAQANTFSDFRVISNSKGKGDEDNNLNKNENTSTNLNVMSNSKTIKTDTLSNYKQELKIEKQIYDLNDKISNVSDLKKESNNFDYYVDFLGVTLAEADNVKLETKPIQKKNCSQENNYPCAERHDGCNIEISDVIKESSDRYLKEHEIETSNKQQEGNLQLQQLQTFIVKFFNDQLNKKAIQQKDVALDSRSLDGANYSLNNCVCCNNSKDDSKNLEVNTFDLLEDHLKKKFKVFKTHNCKSSCITPEAERHIFSTILQKVKQVISDFTNGNQGNESGALIDDGSWRRVYGLMQEYLKVKLKRVKCLQICDENVLPIILDKITNLIEHDFQRLKGICHCTQASNANKNFSPRGLLENYTNTTDMNCNNNNILKPTDNQDHNVKERNISFHIKPSVLAAKVKLCDAVATTKEVTVLSRSNSPIILTQNTSVQVYSNIYRENKCCDIMKIDEQVHETVGGVIYNSRSCHAKANNTSCSLFKPLKTNYIKLERSGYDRKYDNNGKSHGCVISKSVPNLEISKNCYDICQRTNKHDELVPSVGCSVNNTYNKNPKPLFNIKPDIKGFERTKKCIYLKPTSKVHIGKIKNERTKTPNKKSSMNEDLSELAFALQNDNTRATETNLESIDDVFLVLSELIFKNNESVHHQYTNTYDSSHRTDAEILLSPNSLRYKSELKSSFPIFSNSVGAYNSNTECIKSCENDETTNFQSCSCYKVPICHVKMLLDNIENDIMMSRCTCDMMSTVCPVHI